MGHKRDRLNLQFTKLTLRLLISNLSNQRNKMDLKTKLIPGASFQIQDCTLLEEQAKRIKRQIH